MIETWNKGAVGAALIAAAVAHGASEEAGLGRFHAPYKDFSANRLPHICPRTD